MPLGSQPPCGSSMEAALPAAAPALAPAPAPGSAPTGFDPVDVLVGLLDNISRMDGDDFFEAPVREEDAPGYYDVIKRPMCFQRMKDKVLVSF